MSDENKRREGAERLFGALSGVDEKYLAACEEDSGRAANRSKIRVFAQKYGKIAAVLGIAVLGFGLVGLRSADSSIFPEKSMSAEQMRNASGGMSVGEAQQEMAEVMDEEITAEPAERVPGQLQNGASNSLETKGQDDADSSVENVDKYKTDGAGCEAAFVKDTALAAARETAVVGSYLPSVMPPEGEAAWVTREDLAGEEQVTLCWTYPEGKGSFLWTVQNLGEKEPDWTEKLPAGQSVLEGEDMTREDLETQTADALQPDGGITDGIVRICYRADGNYILVEFQGSCDVDTLWAMLCSVGDPDL